MKRILTMIAAALLCSVSLFAKVKIGDLYYNLNGDNLTAEVTSGNYSGLTDVTIPDSVLYEGNYYAVTAIGESAFYGRSSLQSVTIGSNVQTIGKFVFNNSSAFKTIDVAADNQIFCSIDGVLFSKDTLVLIRYPEGNARIEYTIPNNVQTIEYDAFNGCLSLQSIVIPDNVQTIGEYAFYECEKLQSIVIPDNVQTIGKSTFFGCSSLQSVAIPNSVKTIGENAFYGCLSLQSVAIPNSVQTIGEYAFFKCEKLQSMVIPDNVQTIGKSTFFGCSSLLSIALPDKVQAIGENAFYGCSSLQSVAIPNSVQTIGEYAFFKCEKLQSIVIPDNVQTIEHDAFLDCSSLQSVTIGSNVQTIGEFAFNGCFALTTIINHAATPQSIGANVFASVNNACTLYVPAESLKDYQYAEGWGNPGFYFKNIQAFSVVSGRYKIGDLYYNLNGDNMTAEVTYETGDTNNYAGLTTTVIPDSVQLMDFYYTVTAIGEKAFCSCQSLQSVTIGDNVKTIEESAFRECQKLQSVTIPDNVQTIGDRAFEFCYLLQSVTIGSGVQTIGDYAFSDCTSLQSVTIGSGVQTIGYYAFINCSALTTIYNRAATPQRIAAIVFDGVDKNACTLYVPAESLTAYQNADVWKDFRNILGVSKVNGKYKIGDLYYNLNGDNLTAEVTYETDNGNNYAGLIAVTIPDSVMYKGYYYAVNAIEEDAFRDCDMLQSVTIGNGVQTIGQRAFYYCTSLYSISIKGKVRTIGFSAFYNCSSLQSVTIGDNVQTIEKGAFYNCTSLRSVTIGNGVQTIGEYAFYNCYSMHSITIGSGVQTIGRYAFTECEKLQSVIIPDNVQTIEEGAFGNCASLQSVTIGSGVQTIGNHAFVFCGNLATIINRAATPQTIDESVFYNVNKDACSLYVPTESLTGYQNANVWKEFFSIRPIGSQGIHDVQSDNVQSTKVIRNGQLLIEKNGKIYNVQGVEVK